MQHEIDALQDHLDKTPAVGHEEILAVQRETSVLSSQEVALLVAGAVTEGSMRAAQSESRRWRKIL